jgi:hypothetical protein
LRTEQIWWLQTEYSAELADVGGLLIIDSKESSIACVQSKITAWIRWNEIDAKQLGREKATDEFLFQEDWCSWRLAPTEMH